MDALFITTGQLPTDCAFLESLRSNGWQVVKTTVAISESNYQQHKPSLVLVDVRLPDFSSLIKYVRSYFVNIKL
ncbi:unnamed protein product [Thelazia callipaeda]|uniref:Response regulatory domain-containing protein n=1 Tax=Thelazia callipaeda TaxID=103827 RepID=A0A0N5D4C1_THECL|nr:unnamed protein product [Thelazia callipaeda]